MSAAPEYPHLDSGAGQWIPSLARLYYRFANAVDPLDSERDLAEIRFYEQVATWYESIHGQKPTLHDFQKAVILRCIRYLKSDLNP